MMLLHRMGALKLVAICHMANNQLLFVSSLSELGLAKATASFLSIVAMSD